MSIQRIPMIGENIAFNGSVCEIDSISRYASGDGKVGFDYDHSRVEINAKYLSYLQDEGEVWAIGGGAVAYTKPLEQHELRTVQMTSQEYNRLKSELAKNVDALAEMSERIWKLEQKVYDLTYANDELQKNQDHYYMVANKYIRQVEKIGSILTEDYTKNIPVCWESKR